LSKQLNNNKVIMNKTPKTKQELWELYSLHQTYHQRWGGDITRDRIITVRTLFDLGLSDAKCLLEWVNNPLEVKVYPLQLGAVQAYSLSPNGIILRGVGNSILSTREEVLDYFDEVMGLQEIRFLFQD
jgi:hypothetical protein